MYMHDMKTNTLLESSLSIEDVDNIKYTITNYFYTSDEEKWMKDIYKIITTSSISNVKRHKNYKGKLVGITLPRPFISEVLSFRNLNDYLNQFKLFMILLFIEKDGYYPDENNKIFLALRRYYHDKQKIINSILIQEYVYHHLVMYGYISSSDHMDAHLFLDPNSIENLIIKIKRLYNNDIKQSSYAFPIISSDIESFIEQAEAIYDDLDDGDEVVIFEKIKTITLDFIYKMIKPLSDINIDYIFDMVRERSLYLEYLKKSGLEPYKFNDFFMDELYIKLTRQPKMSFLNYICDHSIDLYFKEHEVNTNFKWQDSNEIYQFNTLQIDYLNHMRKFKNVNKNSSKFKGDEYEKFCELWLQKNGYTYTKIIGQKGDKGIDIKAVNPEGKKVGIQCKYKAKGIISSADIRILHVSKEYHDIEEGLLIANCSISREALKDMEKFKITAFFLPFSNI